MLSNYQAYLFALCFSCALKTSVLKASPFLWTMGAAKEPFQCVRSIVQRLRRICAIDSNSIKEAITSSAPVIPILKTPLSDWFFICLSRNPCCCGNSGTSAGSLTETVMELPVPGFSQDGYGQDRKKSGTNGEFKDDNWARNTVWEGAAAMLKYLSDFLGDWPFFWFPWIIQDQIPDFIF